MLPSGTSSRFFDMVLRNSVRFVSNHNPAPAARQLEPLREKSLDARVEGCSGFWTRVAPFRILVHLEGDSTR